MKLSVYLLRESVVSFDEVLQQKYLDDNDGFVELEPTVALPFECKAFVQINRAKTPKWSSFVSDHFEVDQLGLRNQTNSFVLLVHVDQRFFAITFGLGFQSIDRSKTEPRFGLIVAANSIHPERIRMLESNLIDTVTRNRRTHLSLGSDVGEFDLNPNLDWIRKLSGKPESEQFAKSVSGSDSACIGVDCELPQVGEKCSKLLELFQSDRYKAHFGFLDNLRSIARHEPIIEELERELQCRLENRIHERMAVVYPEMPPDEEQVEYYSVSAERRSGELDELTLEGVYSLLDELGINTDAGSIFVVGIGANGEAITKRRSLREYLACEIERGENTLIFCCGDWFQADTDYVERIRGEVAAIAEITDGLELVPIRTSETEASYNGRLADEKQWVLMDRHNFYTGNGQEKVEICDVLSIDWHLVCVKKMDKSSTLSHLFAQGSVSATLLRESAPYISKVNDAYQEGYPGRPAITVDQLGNVTVVYAIATRKDGPLSSSLFFFSLINLLTHARAVRRVGCQVALCRIAYEATPELPRTGQNRRRRRTRHELRNQETP